MRLRDLQLIRFGHFSDLTLDFATAGKHFHVIYGPNEAGKSTALRAISGLLFGIPERTDDDHVHKAPDLRVGAELENGAGARLHIIRRKGRKDTLLGADGSPIAESQLEAYLGGVSREIFEAMFGMNHERLVAGGRELLKGHGEVGEALFGAAAGLQGLHELVQGLETEAGKIFKSGGQVPLLNKALAQHRDARARIKELTLKPSEWEDVRRDRDEAREGLRRVREEHARNKATLEERRTLKAALPDLRQRDTLLARIGEMGEVVLLAEDAPDQRRGAETALQTASLRAAKLQDERARLLDELKRLQVPEALLALEARAADLNDRRAVYVKATSDRQELAYKIDAGKAELEELLRTLPRPRALEEIENLRIDAASTARLRGLARDGEAYHTKVATLREAARTAARRVEDAQTALSAMPAERNTTVLRSTTEAARRAGDLEDTRRGVAAKLASKEEQARQDVLALPLWSGSLKDATALALPSDATVDRFEQEISQLREQGRALDDRQRETQTEFEDLHRQLAALESGGEIPSPDELDAARGQRDGVWARVRRVWLEGATESSPPEALAGEYEAKVSQTDALGDRMFADHGRVAKITTLRGLIKRNETTAAAIEKDRAALALREAENSDAWAAAWSEAGIQPASPREMRSWKAQHRALLELRQDIVELRTEHDALGQSVEAHRNACFSALAEIEGPDLGPDTSLAATLETAERVIKDIDQHRMERTRQKDAAETAAQDKRRCDRELSETQQELDAWRERWGTAITPLDLTADAQPGEAEAVLGNLDQIFSKLLQLKGFEDRVSHIDRDSADFVSSLEGLVRDGCPDLPDMPPKDRSAELSDRLRLGRDHRTRRESKQTRLGEIDTELQEIERDREAAESLLATLAELAGVSSAGELAAAERRSVERQELAKRLAETEERLRRTGKTLEELATRAGEVQEQELILEIDALGGAVEENDREQESWIQKLAALDRTFDEMDGESEAAEAARESEEALARISHLAIEYARRQIAAVVLNREIQRFAAENQGPILQRTSELFRRMTLTRYEGITSDFSEDDQSVILCSRANDETVGVDGLSDGTRDQLFLSLRLAALEHHMKQNEPMPLIVDDVLVAFDDPRSAATLKLMGDLSVDSQILFFTHHQRLVELAREVIPDDRLAVHEIERP